MKLQVCAFFLVFATIPLPSLGEIGPSDNGEIGPSQVASLKESAAEGNAEAQSLLGSLYSQGLYVIEDDVEAVKWFRKAAAQGDATGQAGLAFAYLNGDGIKKDEKEGVKWLKLAAQQGHAKSQIGVGLAYAAGRGGCPKDCVAAYMWFNLAAASGEDGARDLKEKVSTEMTKEQIAEAQKLSREWLEKRRKDTEGTSSDR